MFWEIEEAGIARDPGRTVIIGVDIVLCICVCCMVCVVAYPEY